ncbi:UDP-glucosyltransferase 2-like [Adelges cooleyi]|uniref:UDP-glucosyltransferase 2-like n=1 Tax=Adelges cooleyi TaxID=133065 RepID=UPI0021809060|nr:UDP-glucosyltransferase 2-like [Adelges cooleyi]
MTRIYWLLFGLISRLNAAEILAVSPIAAASHWNVMSSVLEALVARGHKITVVSPFPRKTPHENYTHVDISKYVPFAIAQPWDKVIGVFKPPTACLKFLNENQQHTCETTYNLPEFRQVLQSKRFDVVITELLASRCDLYLASHLGIPQVTIMSSQMLTWYQDYFDSPSIPSYLTPLNSPYPKPETFFQRFWSLVDYSSISLYFKHIDSGATQMGRKYFGDDQPDAEALLRNVSIVFMNTHSSFDLHKPMATNFVEVGGIHLKPQKPLPIDIQKVIDNAEHGVIYFNLGSVTRMQDMPIHIQNAIKEGVAELPQTILWKFETDEPMDGQPKNVFTKKWFPQYDVIRHPNVKLFITHGGNSGTIEAISAGVPVLGFPLYFDQPRNLKLFEYWGSGLYVDYSNFTKEDFVHKIKRIISDQKFKENAVQLSRRFHDRPSSPQDLVVYWMEYVLRHGGAHHLKSHAVDTPWMQYFMLDFMGLAAVAILSLSYFFYSVFMFFKKSSFLLKYKNE